MKVAGAIRKVDDLGRVVVPADIRRRFNWEHHTPLEILVDTNGIFLRNYTEACVFCGTETDTQMFENKHICKNCIARLTL